MPLMRNLSYCSDPFLYQRRQTREVMVGNVGIGGANPIRVQSMITCDTMDTEMSIQQTMELAKVGCEIVRITAPTVKDARNLEHILKGLRERGCDVPIVADIHFKPEAAMEAAKWVDKVRINPGNYADSKKFVIREYSDEQYAGELNRIGERFTPLVELCKKRGIAMRIGTNHGSLSDRILMIRRHPARDGGERARVRPDRARFGLSRVRLFDEGEQSENHDRSVSVAGRATERARPGLELPGPSRCHRSGGRRRRADQERDRNRFAAGRWNRRHHPRFADRRQSARDSGGESTD